MTIALIILAVFVTLLVASVIRLGVRHGYEGYRN